MKHTSSSRHCHIPYLFTLRTFQERSIRPEYKSETISRHFPPIDLPVPGPRGFISKRRDSVHSADVILFSDPGQRRRKERRSREPLVCTGIVTRSPDASHPRFPTPSASPVDVVDDAVHLVAPRRRRRAAAFARDHHSRMEFSRHCHYKRIVTNLVLSFSLCAARQNGLDHRRRSGITVSSISRLIPPPSPKSVIRKQ